MTQTYSLPSSRSKDATASKKFRQYVPLHCTIRIKPFSIFNHRKIMFYLLYFWSSLIFATEKSYGKNVFYFLLNFLVRIIGTLEIVQCYKPIFMTMSRSLKITMFTEHSTDERLGSLWTEQL